MQEDSLEDRGLCLVVEVVVGCLVLLKAPLQVYLENQLEGVFSRPLLRPLQPSDRAATSGQLLVVDRSLEAVQPLQDRQCSEELRPLLAPPCSEEPPRLLHPLTPYSEVQLLKAPLAELLEADLALSLEEEEAEAVTLSLEEEGEVAPHLEQSVQLLQQQEPSVAPAVSSARVLLQSLVLLQLLLLREDYSELPSHLPSPQEESLEPLSPPPPPPPYSGSLRPRCFPHPSSSSQREESSVPRPLRSLEVEDSLGRRQLLPVEGDFSELLLLVLLSLQEDFLVQLQLQLSLQEDFLGLFLLLQEDFSTPLPLQLHRGDSSVRPLRLQPPEDSLAAALPLEEDSLASQERCRRSWTPSVSTPHWSSSPLRSARLSKLREASFWAGFLPDLLRGSSAGCLAEGGETEVFVELLMDSWNTWIDDH